MNFLDELGVDVPVVQAGMGGGVSGAELAAAVSTAGALGTVAIMAPPAFAAALRRAHRAAPGRPIAANLLVPFVRRAHIDACIEGEAALVVFHGGRTQRWSGRLRAAGIPMFATVGTAEQAVDALRDGVDGLVVQGVEAGGHLVGVSPLASALARIHALAGEVPIFAAGGVATAADVRRVLDLGATAAVAGTRFLLTHESGAHPEYKQRVCRADRTLRTELFGFGWPMPHRVVPNAATERWGAASETSPWIRASGRLSAPLGRALPLTALSTLAARQRPGAPLFSPAPPLAGMPDRAVDSCALYAGETALRIDDVISAAEAVARLSPGS